MKYKLCLLFGVVSFVSEIKISVSLVNCCENRLDRFEKTNEMLINFNGLSNVRLQQMNERFLLHTRTLVEMKKDLDSIFRRIRLVSTTPTMQKQKNTPLITGFLCLSRTLKGKIAKQYPEAFSSELFDFYSSQLDFFLLFFHIPHFHVSDYQVNGNITQI